MRNVRNLVLLAAPKLRFWDCPPPGVHLGQTLITGLDRELSPRPSQFTAGSSTREVIGEKSSAQAALFYRLSWSPLGMQGSNGEGLNHHTKASASAPSMVAANTANQSFMSPS